MEVIPAQLAKNQFGDLLMKVQREPVEISKHGKRVAVVISPEEYDQFAQLKLQSLKAILAESIAQADRGELHSIDEVFAPLMIDELEGKTQG
ncbi:type II toxin-antitoxin system Phd/YefM family antitoxin [Salmonella enterica]|uniref:Antitoxin n=2 Tax=Salmonella enterica TaxID=28901 RepID=A0A744FH24_SALER|nr:type II toxin-antitoxin system Phd/YefM family antitoxin [Salmonella enterica subsp. enterica serovar Java]EBR9314729.1 type II toxin-antitoxin system Phd/YefM family antitoxin [Salmonella enterica subsp. enterica serovar Muenchen]EDQ3993440.1 type II toxin-antitoxin system Phd/YefM family antitoxin [Salmonella enterica subsp. enterica]EDS8889787.1 type II toxin-antitoxin system Phd/YefM family antitoxin [Salmonella enterica]EDW9104165.1 type II toxin-antitoxin system Phd/YefM family antitox